MPLSKLIIQKIQYSGVLLFRDFMEMALYYRGLGYYITDLTGMKRIKEKHI